MALKQVLTPRWPLHDIAITNLYGINCNKGRSGDILYCAKVWVMRGGEGGAQTMGLFANSSNDLCTHAST